MTVALVEAGGGATGTRIELRVEGPKIVSARDGMVLTVVDHARNRAVGCGSTTTTTVARKSMTGDRRGRSRSPSRRPGGVRTSPASDCACETTCLAVGG